MSKALLDTLRSERGDLVAFVETTLKDVEGRDLSDAEQRTLNSTKDRIAAIDAQIKPLAEFMDMRSANNDLTRRLNGAEGRQHAETRSWGEQFVESDVFSAYGGRGTSSRIEVETRALPTSLSDISDLLPQKPRIDITDPVLTPLVDAIGTVQVSQNGIDTVVWNTVGGADVVPEGSAKPSAEFVPTVVSLTLDTIAAYTQMTRQMIEDAPAVRSSIDGQLRREVAIKIEAEAAAAIAGATLPTAEGSDLLAAIRAGVGAVQAAGYRPNAVLLNPADWADLDINVFGSTLNGPVIGQSFWGLRPIAANSQPAGTATVGDMGAGVQRYARTGISLYVTDSHADTFLSNVFTLLAEARGKTIVTRPNALVECTALVIP